MVAQGALQESVLIMLVRLVDHIPLPPSPRQARGRPPVYSDRLFLKALVIMIVRHLDSVLAEPTAAMRTWRAVLMEQGRLPGRRTCARRVAALRETLPAQIGCVGRYLVALIEPWRATARAAAIDSTVLRARGGVWHKKDRDAGIVPHTSIETEASWTKAGCHGWV